MHTFRISVILAAASLVGGLAYAEPGSTRAAADTLVSIQGSPARYKLNLDEFAEYRGRYVLADGKVLTVTNVKKRFFAQIDHQPRVEIVPVGHNVFVAKSADLKLLFEEFRDGHVNDVVVTSRAG